MLIVLLIKKSWIGIKVFILMLFFSENKTKFDFVQEI